MVFNKFCHFSELNKETNIASNESRKEESVLAFGIQVVSLGQTCLKVVQAINTW